jgi:demethylspheroidene O-methyltransferase
MRANASGEHHAWAPSRWNDRLKSWRDRCLAAPRFQQWASRFALTRPVARRHAGALFDLCAGFVYSQVLLACVRLGLFELLRAGPLRLKELCWRLELTEVALRPLLAAAQALSLVEPRAPDQWGLGTLGAALLGNPAVPAMIEHHAMLYRDLSDPVALLRTPQARGELARLWPYARNHDPSQLAAGQIEAYTALMAQTQTLVAEELLDAYPFSRHRCLLDVGGGNGTFLVTAALRAPRLRLMLFDLPAVAEQARVRLQAAGLQQRAQTYGGDFASGQLPAGADLITLVRVLHDHDDDAAMTLLQAAHRALPTGGSVLLAEPMAGVRGALPGTEAYFAFYLLAMGQGRVRSAAQIAQMLRAAGFRRPRLRATARPWQCAVVSALA